MNGPSQKRILVLDGDLDIRSKIALFLLGEGYQVELASSGFEALALHRNNPFDAVIMELQLSSVDGFKILFQLQSSSVPPRFIIITGQPGARPHIYLKIARQLGAEAVLAKPFSAGQLRAAVRNVLAAGEQGPLLSRALVENPAG
jgi:DNA-binding response OmpR family regulator